MSSAGYRISDLSFHFSIEIIKLYKELLRNREFVISRQLLRASTSIGANVEEANAAVSERDFVAKMAIASKEARETRYWLRLLDKSKLVDVEYSGYLTQIELIINVLTKIVKTAQQSLMK